jgi:DNA-binding SARP family transcriptional activator
MVYELSNNQAQLLRSLREALAQAREGNFVTPAYCPRDSAARLYALALEHDIESEYVSAIIAKTHLLPPQESTPERWPWRLRIYSLGRFVIVKDRIPVDGGGELGGSKAQKKPLELLRAIVAFGGRDVGITKLTHALWPDTDGDKARITLRSTLLRLRRLVGEEAIAQKGNYLSLNPQYCWLDVWALEQLSDQNSSSTTHYTRAERLFNLYQGAFLPDDDEPWLISQRDRLRSIALRLIIEYGGELEDTDQVAAASDLYQKGIETDPLAEDLYRKLMRCYARQNRQSEALALYQRCRTTLGRLLQIEPTAETTALYREIQGRAAQNVMEPPMSRSLPERM